MAEGGVSQEGEERLPTLQDFLNNVELRSLYEDTEVQRIFEEIEKNPCNIDKYHQHEKVKNVLKLIQEEFDRNPPTAANQNTDQNSESAPGQSDGGNIIEEIYNRQQQ